MRRAFGVGLAVVVCLAGNGWCQLPDEPPTIEEPVTAVVEEPLRTETSDPSATHLIFMPTYDVLPAGTGAWGMADIVVPSLSYSPTDFLQAGVSASVIPAGLITVGMKARLWRSPDGLSGLAAGIFHAGIDVFDNAGTGDATQLTSAYLTAGTHAGEFEFHTILMRMRTRWYETVAFSPAPFGGNPQTGEEVRYTTMFGVGIKAPSFEQTKAVLECWAWNDGGRMVLLALPALQVAHDGGCAELGSPAIVISDEIEVGFLPILFFTMSFN